MIDHISIGVRDLAKGERFYAAALAMLGFAKLKDWEGAAIGFGKKYPEFWINKGEAMGRVAEDSGVHICLRAPDTASVDAFTRPRSKLAVPLMAHPGHDRIITSGITRPSSAIRMATASKR
jgi:catechol 2,3-dioxygenase-like lactoylglutathione lyase family enzyme